MKILLRLLMTLRSKCLILSSNLKRNFDIHHVFTENHLISHLHNCAKSFYYTFFTLFTTSFFPSHYTCSHISFYSHKAINNSPVLYRHTISSRQSSISNQLNGLSLNINNILSVLTRKYESSLEMTPELHAFINN